jgi:hypothetical protein
VNVLEPGDSGGPIFLAGTGVTKHVVVAVNSGHGATSQNFSAFARTDLLADWLAGWVASDQN